MKKKTKFLSIMIFSSLRSWYVMEWNREFHRIQWKINQNYGWHFHGFHGDKVTWKRIVFRWASIKYFLDMVNTTIMKINEKNWKWNAHASCNRIHFHNNSTEIYDLLVCFANIIIHLKLIVDASSFTWNWIRSMWLELFISDHHVGHRI